MRKTEQSNTGFGVEWKPKTSTAKTKKLAGPVSGLSEVSDLLNFVDDAPVNVEPFVEVEFDRPEQSRGFQFLPRRDNFF